MKKKNSVQFMVVIIGLGFVTQLFIFPIARKYIFRIQHQEPLAHQLGVKIDDYPYPSSFPEGYFYAVLEPGMALSQVHAIVQGYEKVYNCFGTDELYYYFNANDDHAQRFMILYDGQLRYEDIRGEDENSRTLGAGPECATGLLEKK